MRKYYAVMSARDKLLPDSARSILQASCDLDPNSFSWTIVKKE